MIGKPNWPLLVTKLGLNSYALTGQSLAELACHDKTE